METTSPAHLSISNIPEIGLSMSPIEKLIYANDVSEINQIITTYFGNGNDLSVLLKNAAYVYLKLINDAAQGSGYTPGILYGLYEVAIGSGMTPLLIFMGVGACDRWIIIKMTNKNFNLEEEFL